MMQARVIHILLFIFLVSCSKSPNKKKEAFKTTKLETQEEVKNFDLFLKRVISEGYVIDSIENKR